MHGLSELTNKEIPLHHFYLIEGQGKNAVEELCAALRERGALLPDTSNALIQTYETILVGDTELLRSHASFKNSGEHAQLIIISTLAITHEAQQALLKVLEEPHTGVHFFFIIPRIEEVLLTIRSRAHVLDVVGNSGIDLVDAKKFIALSKKERLEYVGKLVKGHDDDESSGALRHHATQFISALQTTLHENPENLKKYKNVLTDTINATGYLANRGASVKMILEHIALSL